VVRLRRLNSEGMSRLEQFLDDLDAEPSGAVPSGLLQDSETSEAVAPEVEVEERSFNTRFELANYLHSIVGDSGIDGVERDRGIWTWLTCLYFEQLCPVDSEGLRSPRQRARLIPVLSDARKYYRHLLLGPYRVYRAHRDDPERIRCLLANPVHQPGEVYEQLASRQALAGSPVVMAAVSRLYCDPTTGQRKRGAASKGPGGASRLADVLMQFDLTWDLRLVDPGDLLDMLPSEFDRFRED